MCAASSGNFKRPAEIGCLKAIGVNNLILLPTAIEGNVFRGVYLQGWGGGVVASRCGVCLQGGVGTPSWY